MVEILRKSLLEYQIELCRKYGFKNIYILIHRKSDVIKRYFGGKNTAIVRSFK